MRVCFMGAGGLASCLGGYLAQSGVEVTLIGRRAENMEAVNKDGLRIEGVRGAHHVTSNLTAVTDPNDAKGEFDYFILTTKGKDGAAALAQAAKLKDRCRTVLSLQNSLVKEERLIAWAGAEKVLGGTTIEGAELAAPGRVKNHTTVDVTAYFGELDGTISARATAITDAFNAAGLSTRAVDNIRQVIWEKLTQVGGASSWSVSLLAGNPDLSIVDGWTVREGVEYYVRIVRDLLAVYKAQGYEPQNFFAPISHLKEMDALDFEAAVEKILAQGKMLREKNYVARTSMHVDVLKGRKTEVDDILKPFIDKAAEMNIPVPTLAGAYCIIKTLDTYLE